MSVFFLNNKLHYYNVMEKINFSGGEPFIHQNGKFVGNLVQFCKEVLKLPSVTIVSNGSLIKESWFQAYGKYLDILAISCDSFDEPTNQLIGRGKKNHDHIEQLYKISSWCQKYQVLFKINTVVNSFNVDEDMSEQINKLNPHRWKVFQCLLLEGENVGEAALRNAERFYISNTEFDRFIQKHNNVKSLVPESNEAMKDSYLILDEKMRFLNCQRGGKEPTKSILDIGVNAAFSEAGFDEAMFNKRGGIYNWSKHEFFTTNCCETNNEEVF